ncbi:F-box protein At3g62230 [Linum grandiflorum]
MIPPRTPLSESVSMDSILAAGKGPAPSRRRKRGNDDQPEQPPRKKRVQQCGSSRRCSSDEVDRISHLPDEILLLLLSRLTFKEAVLTSILSTRWRFLWISHPRLVIGPSFFPRTRSPRHALNVRALAWRVGHIEKIVQSYQGQTLDEFKLHLDVCDKYSPFVGSCLEFALSKNVKVLDLDFSLPFGFTPKNQWERSYIFKSMSSVSFTSLKSLRLKCIRISARVLEDLVSNCCPVLERLELDQVFALGCVKIAGPSLRLKHLDIGYCDDLYEIEICDVVPLVSFKSLSPVVTHLVGMKNLPLLTQLSISFSPFSAVDFRRDSHGRDNLSYFSGYHDQLNRLTLYLSFANLGSVKHAASYELLNLRELEIVEMEMEMEEQQQYNPPAGHSGGMFKHLKVLEIAGYAGRSGDDKFIAFMVANVASLETIIINLGFRTCPPFSLAIEGMYMEVHKSVEEDERQNAKLRLERIIPPTIHLVIQ